MVLRQGVRQTYVTAVLTQAVTHDLHRLYTAYQCPSLIRQNDELSIPSPSPHAHTSCSSRTTHTNRGRRWCAPKKSGASAHTPCILQEVYETGRDTLCMGSSAGGSRVDHTQAMEAPAGRVLLAIGGRCAATQHSLLHKMAEQHIHHITHHVRVHSCCGLWGKGGGDDGMHKHAHTDTPHRGGGSARRRVLPALP